MVGSPTNVVENPPVWSTGLESDRDRVCPVPPDVCCPDTLLPKVITVVVADNGGCPCVSGANGTLAWSNAQNAWIGTIAFPGCGSKSVDLNLRCGGGGFGDYLLSGTGDLTFSNVPFFSTANCDPWQFDFQIFDAAATLCAAPGFLIFALVG